MEESNKYCFKSSLFEIEVGEDRETNPACYGKNLAKWLESEFQKLGYKDAAYGPEDWGWYVSCVYKPYHIFIACGSFVDYESEYDESSPPKGNEVIWQCFIGADRPFFRNLFKKIDTSEEIRIEKQLFKLLDSTQGILKTEEP